MTAEHRQFVLALSGWLLPRKTLPQRPPSRFARWLLNRVCEHDPAPNIRGDMFCRHCGLRRDG